jgi:hypothetical protein
MPNPPRSPSVQARGSSAGGGSLLPIIYLEGGRLPWIVSAAERALIAAGGGELYQRGGMIVRPIRTAIKTVNQRDAFRWHLHEVTVPYLVELLTSIIRFQQFDGRKNDWVDKDCPTKVAETYVARVGKWKIAELQGVVNTPFIREDGSLCEHPGYDHISKLLYDPDGQNFPAIPAAPSKDDASEALGYINKTLFKEFPFVGNVDRAVTLSAVLTAFDQRVTAAAPMHGFSAPTAGTGKSLIIDLISILLNGRSAPVIAFGGTDDELEKRLETALIAGDPIIMLDNVTRDLISKVLVQALTQQEIKIRLLGHSRDVVVPATATFFATGNNLTVSGGELPRRVLISRLDAKTERPELREFQGDAIETAFNERGKLVTAVLTILRAWQVADPTVKKLVKAKPLGLYKRWSQRVRLPLIWLGCADPCDSIEDTRKRDPELGELAVVLMQWEGALGTSAAYMVQQVITRAIGDPDFFNALAEVALSRQGLTLNNHRLGRWLSRNEGRISNDLKLERGGNAGGYPLWRVRKV